MTQRLESLSKRHPLGQKTAGQFLPNRELKPSFSGKKSQPTEPAQAGKAPVHPSQNTPIHLLNGKIIHEWFRDDLTARRQRGHWLPPLTLLTVLAVPGGEENKRTILMWVGCSRTRARSPTMKHRESEPAADLYDPAGLRQDVSTAGKSPS